MKTTVRDAISDILKLEKVDYVFGHTGGHIMLLWDAIDKKGLKTVFNKQEGNATYMADCYARLSGKPSVVLGTSGPGIQNTVTGLASAYLDSVPLIAIGAGVETSAAGKNALQESSGRGRATDQLMIFKGITKQANMAQTPHSTPGLIREAFRTAASGRPGPVYVEIPSDFWNAKIEYLRVDPKKYKNTTPSTCDKNASQEILKALLKSKKPALVIGEGAIENNINEKMMKFINTAKIPFYVTPKAKDFCDEFHELFIGALRCHRKTPREYGYLKKSDFILFLGCRMGQWEFDWDYRNIFNGASLAQVDPDPNEIGRVYGMDYSAVGSISSFINTPGLRAHKDSKMLEKEAQKYNFKLIRPRRLKDGDGLHPLNLNNITEDLLPERAVVIADTAYAGSMAINKFRTRNSQRFIISDYNSPMGYALPAAIGATFFTKDQVVCLIGDGSFQMTFNELGTLMNYKKKVVLIIENNGGCISIKNNMDSFYQVEDDYCATRFENPDFVKIAEAYGLAGIVVKTAQEYEEVLRNALVSPKSTIIDARIDQKLMDWE